MYLFSAIMLLTAAAVLYIAARVYRGDIGLVISHHTERVADKKRYCKTVGISLFIIGAGIAASGISGFWSDTKAFFLLSMISLTTGLIVGLTGIIIAQKKYNGGIF